MRTSTVVSPGDAGWPRPRAPWRFGEDDRRCPGLPDRLPVPWINGPRVEAYGDWHTFRDNALQEMVAGRLCLICGEAVVGPVYLPRQGGPRSSGGRHTSGGGGHARCVFLAVMCCPHMVESGFGLDDIVGWRWDGPGIGLVNTNYQEEHGYDDEVEPGAVEITLRELRAATRLPSEGVPRACPA